MKSLNLFINRVVQADSVTFLPMLPDCCIDLVVTDPPYLVNYHPRDGRRCDGDTCDTWLRPVFRELYRVLKPNSICATFYGWPNVERFMLAWKEVGFRPVSHLVWKKQHCCRDGYTRGFHEVGYLLAKGNPKKPETPPPDVLPWEYTGNRFHTNEKPVVAITPVIEAFSRPDDIVLDPFAGAGTTGIAATSLGRRFILVEKSIRLCDIARKRMAP